MSFDQFISGALLVFGAYQVSFWWWSPDAEWIKNNDVFGFFYPVTMTLGWIALIEGLVGLWVLT